MTTATVFLQRTGSTTAENIGVVELQPKPEKGLKVTFTLNGVEETGIVDIVDITSDPCLPSVRIIADHPPTQSNWEICREHLRALTEREGGRPREEAGAIVHTYLAREPQDQELLVQYLTSERDRLNGAVTPLDQLTRLSRCLAAIEGALQALKTASAH